MPERPSILIALLCCPHDYCDDAVRVHIDKSPEEQLARAAKKAATTGSRKDLQEYLRLRRILL